MPVFLPGIQEFQLLDEPVKKFAGLPALWPRFIDAAFRGAAERFQRLLAGIELSVLPRSSFTAIGSLTHARDFLPSKENHSTRRDRSLARRHGDDSPPLSGVPGRLQPRLEPRLPVPPP